MWHLAKLPVLQKRLFIDQEIILQKDKFQKQIIHVYNASGIPFEQKKIFFVV